MTSSERESYRTHMFHREKDTPDSLARQLSWEWVRLELFHNESTRVDGTIANADKGYSVDDVLKRPDKWLPILYRDLTLIVSPHSAALGGTVRYQHEQIQSWFPENAREPELVELSYFDEINRYLLDVGLKVKGESVSEKQYWNSMGRMQRKELLERLAGNVGDRKQLMLTERNLRSRVAKLDTSVKWEDIYNFVQRDIKLVSRFEGAGNIVYNLACAYFGAAIDAHMNWFGGILQGGIAGLGAGQILKGEIVKSKARAVLEFAIPRIQVANYVRSQLK
jgi:hypothetical protein